MYFYALTTSRVRLKPPERVSKSTRAPGIIKMTTAEQRREQAIRELLANGGHSEAEIQGVVDLVKDWHTNPGKHGPLIDMLMLSVEASPDESRRILGELAQSLSNAIQRRGGELNDRDRETLERLVPPQPLKLWTESEGRRRSKPKTDIPDLS